MATTLVTIRTLADRNGQPMIVGWMENGQIKVFIATQDDTYPWLVWWTIAGDPWINTTVA